MSTLKKRLSKYLLCGEHTVDVDLKKSQGSWVVDQKGNKFLDCFSQYGSQALGWNHPDLLSEKDRLLDVVFNKLANPEFYSRQYLEFVETFADHTEDFKYHFYIDGGTLGVENALKAAFDWKLQKLGWDDNKSNKLDVVHLKHAFHGRSGYTLSLTNTSPEKIINFPKFKWTRIDNPKVEFGVDLKEKIHESLSHAAFVCAINPVAAILVEPIQSEGGDCHLPPEFLLGLRNLADKHDVMLIFDEVQTGVGMTGRFWAYQHFVKPDMIVFGKKMQTCGFCCSKRIDEVKDNVFKVDSRINSTWGGNLVDMVRSTIILEIIENERLVDNAEKVGIYFLNKLKEIIPENLNPRGRGLMIAFDLKDTEERNDILNKLSEKVLCIKCGEKSIRFRPHLDISCEEVDFVIECLKSCLPHG